ncbi:MAG: amidohydrolase family protein [Acidobacteria bacterium]|nr:amidohydrolase family protein [Acidobacteriota bacterium]
MCLALLALAIAAMVAAQPYDVLITGGRIMDGTGNPWYEADLAIRGDRITAVGRLAGRPANQIINARGLVVAPGFIDIHSHGGRGVAQNPALESAVRQGMTTLIEGNDGGSPVPLGPALDKLAATPTSINIGYFIGQGAIRRNVVGLVNRKATAAEIARMKELARQGMLDGAFGLSTGLFYIPGNFTPTEEVIELAKVVAPFGGIHVSHMRDEAAGILDSVRETIRIGEEGGLPTQLTHHKIVGRPNWGRSTETLELVEQARARGVDVTIDQYPYTASHTGSSALFPQWAQEGGSKALAERLKAPDMRKRIIAEMIILLRDNRGGGDPKNVQFSRCEFDPSLAGKTLADVTRARSLEPTFENAANAAIDIQLKGGCSAIYHAIREDDVERIMRSPWTMVASDGEAPIFGKASPSTFGIAASCARA